jgi:hypothetical protein
MQSKNKKLPALSSKVKSTVQRDRLKIEEMLLDNAKNRLTHKDYRHDQEFS